MQTRQLLNRESHFPQAFGKTCFQIQNLQPIIGAVIKGPPVSGEDRCAAIIRKGDPADFLQIAVQGNQNPVDVICIGYSPVIHHHSRVIRLNRAGKCRLGLDVPGFSGEQCQCGVPDSNFKLSPMFHRHATRTKVFLLYQKQKE